jgi:hypothetical protein
MKNKLTALLNNESFSNNIRIQLEKLRQQETHYNNVLLGRWNKVIAMHINKNNPFIELGYRVIITQDNEKTNFLSQNMSRCFDGIKCGSPGCPKCFNEFRKNTQVSLSKVKRGQNCKVITILLHDCMMTDKQFLKHDTNILKEVLWQHLENAEIHSNIHGHLSYCYHADSGLWLPTFMLICFESDSGQLRALNNSLLNGVESSDSQTRGPMHVKSLQPQSQIPLFPEIDYSSLALTDVNGKKKPARIRLKPIKMKIALRVYERIGFEGIKFS